MTMKTKVCDAHSSCSCSHAESSSVRNLLHDRLVKTCFSDESQDVEKLTFHIHCGTHAAVINGQRTAHRPK